MDEHEVRLAKNKKSANAIRWYWRDLQKLFGDMEC